MIQEVRADDPLRPVFEKQILQDVNNKVKRCQGEQVRPDQDAKGTNDSQHDNQVNAHVQQKAAPIAFSLNQPAWLQRIITQKMRQVE